MLEDIDQSNDNTCRLENIGKYAVPICGHDVITEFMVQDLKSKPNKGVLLYGGLYANESEDRFFWYVSTLRTHSLTKIPTMVEEGVKVSKYLTEVVKGNRIKILYEAFKKPLSACTDIEDINSLIDLGLLKQAENGALRLTEKGIELCCILGHLTINHRVKPPVQQLNEIFEPFARAGLYSKENQIEPNPSLTIDSVMQILSRAGELENLERAGINSQTLQDVIQLYLCPPF